MRTIILVLCCVLIVFSSEAVFAAAKKKHPPGSEGRECIECHADQTKAWEGGPHGLMNVKCVVCHGSPESNFAPKPGPDKCRGCHAEQVDAVVHGHALSMKTCAPCHDRHTLVVRSPFHRKGGI
jgi:hypothetical protein